MHTQLRKKRKSIFHPDVWLTVGLLAVMVSISWVLLANLLGGHSAWEKNVIALTPRHAATNYQTAYQTIKRGSGMTTADDKTAWESSTNIDLFHASYTDEQGNVKVKSEDGQKIIAPGTSSRYSFSVTNNDIARLNYELTMEGGFSQELANIPLQFRLYQGTEWLVGSSDTWGTLEDVNSLDVQTDLASGGTDAYQLEWQWPYEGVNGADADFAAAVDDDTTFQLTITTKCEAMSPSDHGHGGGSSGGGSSGGNSGGTTPTDPDNPNPTDPDNPNGDPNNGNNGNNNNTNNGNHNSNSNNGNSNNGSSSNGSGSHNTGNIGSTDGNTNSSGTISGYTYGSGGSHSGSGSNGNTGSNVDDNNGNSGSGSGNTGDSDTDGNTNGGDDKDNQSGTAGNGSDNNGSSGNGGNSGDQSSSNGGSHFPWGILGIILAAALAGWLFLIFPWRRKVYVTGFVAAETGTTMECGKLKDRIRRSGRFAFQKVAMGSHRFGLGETEVPWSIKRDKDVKGINFTETGDSMEIVIGKDIRAVEVHLIRSADGIQWNKAVWAAIDGKRNVYTTAGVQKPDENGENRTPDGLMVDAQNHYSFDTEEKA